MIRIRGYAIGVFAVGLLFLGAASAGSAGHLQIEGEWSLTAREGERVQLTLHWKSKDHTMSSITEWSLDRLEGLSPEQLHSDGTPVRFRILTANRSAHLRRSCEEWQRRRRIHIDR